MHNIWKLFCYDAKHLFGNVVTVVFILALVLLPSIFTWYNVIACWSVFDNTGYLKVAVANSDEGYESDLLPTAINVGDKVESALRENDQLDWVFTTEEDAIDGAKSGKYYAAVVIPENFSRDMMSFYTSDAESAQIIYYENEKKNAVAPRVTDQASSKVSAQVNTTFAETLSDVSLGLVDTFSTVLDEGDATGTFTKLSTTISSSADQMNNTADVLDSYAALTKSARTLVDSSNKLLGDAQAAVTQAEGQASGAKEGAITVGDAMKTSVSALSDALEQSTSSFDGVSGSIDEVYDQMDKNAENGAQNLRNRADDINAQIAQYQVVRDELDQLEANVDEQYQPVIQSVVKQLDASIEALQKLRDSLNSGADSIEAGKGDAGQKRTDVQAKVEEARSDIAALKTDYDENLKPGLEELANSVSTAASQLSSRASQLSGVSDSLESSANTVSGKLSTAQDSIETMANELRASADKLDDLSARIKTALNSGKLDSLKEVIGSDPTALAKAVSAPVGVERVAVFAADNFGSAMAPLYTTLALWVGALLMMVLVNPVVSERAKREAGLENPKSHELFFGRWGATVIISLMQSTVLCLGNMLFVGVQVENPLLYLICFWVAGIVFGFIVYTMVSLFANLGKAIAVLLLIVQVTGGGGSFPLQLLPEFFQNISPFLPATHIINAMRAASFGVYQNDFWIEICLELAFLIPFIVMGLLRPMLSKLTYWFVEQVEKSKLVA